MMMADSATYKFTYIFKESKEEGYIHYTRLQSLLRRGQWPKGTVRAGENTLLAVSALQWSFQVKEGASSL